MRLCFSFVVLLASVSVYLVSEAHAARFTGLGDLPGGNVESYARAISADGRFVVGSSGSEFGTSDHAFRWSLATGMLPLHDDYDGISSSMALAVTANGSVVIGSQNGTAGSFRWMKESGAQLLPFNAQNISADGQVIIGESGGVAFKWTEADGIVPLGVPQGADESRIYSLSANGSVIVGSSVAQNGGDRLFEATRWTKADGFLSLGDLPGGVFNSAAIAVSQDGAVIVGHSNSSLGEEPFRWTFETGMVGLGDLPGGSVNGVAWATSGNGSIVVGQSSAGTVHPSGDAAFIWDEVHGMRNLQSVLTSEYGFDLSGWLLISARGISASGKVITGDGINPNGDVEAWIVAIPEPASSILVSVIVAALFTVRERRN